MLLALALIPIFYLHFTALRAADDFYYSTFWMNGPAEFWRLTLHHYQAFNGRALVHFVAQTVLAFPPVVFAALNTALLLGIGYLGGLIQGTEKHTRAILWAILLFLIQILVLPKDIITEGLLWVSASYNYMFPVFLTVLALFVLWRFLEGKRKGFFRKLLFGLFFILVQFAAGATTEQCGFMAAAATGIYGLIWAIRTHKGWYKLFLAPLLATAGYLTVFLSPATQRRAERSVSVEADSLSLQFDRLVKAFFSWDGILLPLILAAVLLILCLLIPKARKKLNRATLALLVGGAASAAIMLPTGNFDPRVMLPWALTLLLVSARCILLLLSLFKKGSPLPLFCCILLLGASLALCSPLLTGAAKNYALEKRNRAAVREAWETGVLYYDIDYDERWCYPSLMYTEGSFYSRFLDANRLNDCTVYLESAHMKNVYLNGRRLSSPGYERDGKVFFALRDVIEGFGGTVGYDQGIYIVNLDGQEVKIYPVLIANYWPDGIYTELDISDMTIRRYCKAAYTAEAYKILFGIDIRPEGDRYVCKKEPLN